MGGKNILINELQFYWRLKDSFSDKNVVPDFLPFESGYDKELGLLIQKRNKKVLKALEIVYQEEPNIGNIQDLNQWGNLYAKDFLDFVDSSLTKQERFKKILEVGCGGCVLLKLLKDRGYEVMGIDPSPFAQKEGKRKNIKIIKDFFPSPRLKEKFDFIFHSDVLEHTADPVDFLKSQYNQLSNEGVLVFAVPNCTDSIIDGDISMFLHQHLNYFDVKSLKNTVAAAGFIDIGIEKAKYGGSLYCMATKNDRATKEVLIPRDARETKYKLFLKRYLKNTTKFREYIEKILVNKNKSLGFYAPVRVLPYLAMTNLYKGFRFFDDSSHWHLKYFDGIKIPIENFDDFKKEPVTDLIIMSPTFGEIIKQKVIDFFPTGVNVRKLTDFFN